jgi:multiple sugar transport system permease protein
MSVTGLQVKGTSLPPVPESGRAQRKRQRQSEDQGVIPLRLYGVKRGTVTLLTVLCGLFTVFTLVPIAWIVINSTKTQGNLLNSFGFWFARPFEFFKTFSQLFDNVDGEGVYFRWFLNTLFYAAVGGVGAAAVSTLAGYGFARFDFRGVKALFVFVLAALLVPLTAITYPLYLIYSKVGLIDSIWGMILPSLVAPVGVYLMRTFVRSYVPRELIDAARVDGAGELKIFLRVALPLMVPGVMTVLLISVVAVWNNYFLPFIIFSKNNLFPLTVGLGVWATRAQNSGDQRVFPLIVVGGLITIIPLVLVFLVVQRRWRGGLLIGSFAN